MSMTPAVSVIMNCHNSAQYLRESIESVYAQSFKDWEIIFWDNASTDSSAEIAKSYDGRIKYYRNDCKVPLGQARNSAIGHASGKYIAFLDCDDIWLPLKLEMQVAFLESNSDVDFLHSNCLGWNMSNGKKWTLISSPQPSGDVFEYHLADYSVYMLTAIIRKQALDQLTELFDETLNYTEELDVFLRLFIKSKVHYMPATTAIYRIHPRMSTVTYGIESIMNETEYVIEKLIAMDSRIPVRYAAALNKVTGRIAFHRAKSMLFNHRITEARQLIARHRIANLKNFALYLCTFLPYPVWHSMLSLLRTGKRI